MHFHTSEQIPGIGSDFDATQFIDTLQRARVDAITRFAKCHHGWCHYDTRVGRRHPGLAFDLLRAQYEACLRADIAVQIFVTAVSYLSRMDHKSVVGMRGFEPPAPTSRKSLGIVRRSSLTFKKHYKYRYFVHFDVR